VAAADIRKQARRKLLRTPRLLKLFLATCVQRCIFLGSPCRGRQAGGGLGSNVGVASLCVACALKIPVCVSSVAR
jgi:hypothetical protein